MAIPTVDNMASELRPNERHQRNWQLNLASLALAVAVVAILIWGSMRVPATSVRENLTLPEETLTLKGAALQGSRTAPAVILVFSDFQCPFCGKVARDILPTIANQYVHSGRALLAFRHFPLVSLHAFAWGAAVAAVCAGEQHMFWPLHDALFADQKHLTDVDLRTRAAQVGLDSRTFERCIASTDTDTAVQRDADVAAALGLSGTPTIFVGIPVGDAGVKVERRFDGTVTVKALTEAVDQVSGVSDRNK